MIISSAIITKPVEIPGIGVTSSLPVAGQLTPPQISTAYNMPISNGEGVTVGILSLGGGFLQSDLDRSINDLVVAGLLPPGTVPPTIIPVPVNQQPSWTPTTNFSNDLNTSNGILSFENTLDLICVAGLVPNATIKIYIGNQNLDIITCWTNVLNQMVDENCDIITMSYAVDESFGFGDFLSAPLSRAENKGITVLAASGDQGSQGNQPGGGLSVCYPASNPKVIAVGGTDLTLNTNNQRISPETANPSSGGGISALFLPQPSWQTGLRYTPYNIFSGNSASKALTSRGVPDVSAPYQTYAFYFDGSIIGASGTSAACPIFAGMLTRFQNLAGRRLPLSNSIFYSKNNTFYDVTNGNNANFPYNGYSATVGWDAVTGLGTPNGQNLYNSIPNIKVKTTDSTWSPVKNIQVKTAADTWTPVKTVWVKTQSGWQQTY